MKHIVMTHTLAAWFDLEDSPDVNRGANLDSDYVDVGSDSQGYSTKRADLLRLHVDMANTPVDVVGTIYNNKTCRSSHALVP